ncbi:hypothetical protein ACNKHP_08225 [Shigella boydii]
MESEIGRTTNPVRMYMREMGTVSSRSRRRNRHCKTYRGWVESGSCSVVEYPEAITYLLEQYDRVEREEAVYLI